MSWKNKEIARRFYSLHPVKNQQELANLLKVKPATVSQWMNGISPVPRKRLQKAYNENRNKVDLNWVLGVDLDGKSDPSAPQPNFRTELAGLGRDTLSFIQQLWNSRAKGKKWPDILIPKEADPDPEALSKLTLDRQLTEIELAISCTADVLNNLPSLSKIDDFSTEETIPLLLLNTHLNQLLSHRMALLGIMMALRISRLERMQSTAASPEESEPIQEPYTGDPTLLEVCHVMANIQEELNHQQRQAMAGKLTVDQFSRIVGAVAKSLEDVGKELVEEEKAKQPKASG